MTSVPLRTLALALVVTCLLASAPALATSKPPWMSLAPGTIARVDIASWLIDDEPEAALTASPQSAERNFSDDATHPDDVVYRPAGVRVRVVRVLANGTVALVHGVGDRFEAYAPVERLVPEVPDGTHLVAAGGFDGFAYFYPTIETRQAGADRIATGSRLMALGMGVAPYDPDSADLVRVRVRVLDGNQRGRVGWITVAYTGLAAGRPVRSSDVAETACDCRLVEFTQP